MPKRYVYANLIAFALIAAYEVDTNETRTYVKAVNNNDLEKWKAAMNEEMQSLSKNHT